MITASIRAVRTPAAAPYSSTELKRNVSDTEICAGIPGSFTVADPLTRVSSARISHWLLGHGPTISAEACATAQLPARMTVQTYKRPRSGITGPGWGLRGACPSTSATGARGPLLD